MDIPQGLQGALNDCVAAKTAADAALVAKQATAATLAQSQAADDAAAQDLRGKTDLLAQARQKLESIEDLYFQVGAVLPDPPPAPPPVQAAPALPIAARAG